MPLGIANSQLRVSRSFDLIKDSLLQHEDLPLTNVIDCDCWQAVFDKHEIDFGSDEGSIYTPAITLGFDFASLLQSRNAQLQSGRRTCRSSVGHTW